MAGGIRAWHGLVARTPVDQGRWLLEGDEEPAAALALAYGLEEGSRRFYRELAGRAPDPATRDLFQELTAAEVRHEERLWERYRTLAGPGADREAFVRRAVPRALEGGLSPDQALARAPGGPPAGAEALDLAMALEVDALDLYLRLAGASHLEATRDVFLAVAEEEKAHLRRLGRRLGEVAGGAP